MSHFSETIKKMQDITNDIKNKAEEKLSEADGEATSKVEAIANKTIDVINEAAFKLKGAMDKIEGADELDDFLKRVEEKCLKARDYAFKKFEEIVPDEEKDVEKLSMEKFLDNENISNASKFVLDLKDSFVKFYKSPETQLKINKAELAVLKLASKGLDLIKSTLDKTKKDQ